MATAVARARPASDRVQGIDARLSDLALRDGRKVAIEIGHDIIRTPTLKRTMEGSSSISLGIYDSEFRLLQVSLLAENFDAEIDGLHFRYVGTSKAERNFTVTLEDRGIALLREKDGPVRVFAHRGKPNETTRAEFVKALVEEAAPHLEFICPQLHKQQPVATKKQAKKANQEAKDRREPGIGATNHLTVDGVAATKPQKELGETALRIANSRPCPGICKVAVIAALMDESSMGTTAAGNVLEALEPFTKVRDAAQEISGFLFGEPEWTGTTAVGYYEDHPQATFYEIAQEVQKSGAGKASKGQANYGKFGDEAREWVEAFDGELGESGSETVKVARTFEVKPKENYWTAIKRLAKDVNWRAFCVGERFYFIDEFELARGMVRLAIDPDTPGIPPANVDFDYSRNKKVTEVKLNKVPVHQWKPPPGSVVTLAGYGPASVGFGDAPVQANAKGQKAGLSNNRKAGTGEGRGRYLVASIETPLTESSDARFATIILKKPTAPLPEPEAKTKTVSSGSPSSAAGNKTVERVLEALENAAALKKGYVWGGEDPSSGVDCSGAVSFGLRVGGFMEGRTDTKGLASFGEAGRGEFITVYDHANTGDAKTEHCAIEVAGVVFESGGGSENENPKGGLGKVAASQVSSFLSQFEIKRHPKGF